MTREEIVFRIRHFFWEMSEPSIYEMCYLTFSVYEEWLAQEPKLEQI